MNISLGDRTAETVRIYFDRAQDRRIRSALPMKAQTVDEALRDYEATQLPGASSYGRTILADGVYVGDIWCYCIDNDDEPNAMLSYCVFDADSWNRGIASAAVGLFLRDACARYGLKTVGAFTFSDNAASVRVLEKNGFCLMEKFVENGRESKFFLYENRQ
ncbi:MAG: GNAT family N-acetyltransferase [Oscillospiraceae bacterium]|nr:GNAT family N-acetyltransferase [Oscillospiraceae bacterium]